MSKRKKGTKNVGRNYRQLFFSGFKSDIQPGNEDGNSKTVKQVAERQEPVKGARCYKILVPVIIEQTSYDSGQYNYRILLNDNANLPISPYSIRGKKDIGPSANAPKKEGRRTNAIHLVYGVHEDGVRALSHTNQSNVQPDAAQIYSFVLGQIDRAIECTIFEHQNGKGDDDTGKRVESTSPSKSVRSNKKTRRSKKVLPEVLPETLPEEPARMVEVDREVLGWGPMYTEAGHIRLGGYPDDRGNPEKTIREGGTPNIEI